MTLESGRSIAHYRLVEKIGEGGMGVVWRAADSTLGRDVAVKILPERFAADPERMARFEREARLLASLQHANIAAIYGLHSADGVRFLAMELVEGEDLAARIARGPMPAREVLPIARQIAEALEAAHEKGILHRDLKPANIKLGPEGQVKLLDFGLAKALETGPASGSAPNLSQSPTITAMTQADVILGTAAYMSPEQARGRSVDRRADIWSFGVVLFEMLTGRQLFQGETVSDTLAAVLKTEPDWSDLPRETPRLLVDLIRRCLERDARQRLRDVGEARIVLERVERGAGDEPLAAPVVVKRSRIPPLAYAAIGLALGAVAMMLVPRGGENRAPQTPIRRYLIATANGKLPAEIALSNDGTSVAYRIGDSLWVQELDRLDPRALAVESGLHAPFWSPDGRFVAYLAGTRVVKVAVATGERQVVCETRKSFTGGSGASWGEDGTIVMSHAEDTGLLRVADVGGDARTILAPDTTMESDFHDPHILPGGRGILMVPHQRTGIHTIVVWNDGKRKVLLDIEGQSFSNPQYVPSGHIVFQRAGENAGIWALPFSLDRLEAIGEPFLIASGARMPTVARDGSLMYLGGTSSAIRHHWVGRDGRPIGPAGPEIGEGGPVFAISPDGKRFVFSASDADAAELWVVDAVRGTKTRLTFDPDNDVWPSWSPDGTYIVYQAMSKGCARFDCINVLLRRADGTGVSDTLVHEAAIPSLSPDGRYVVYSADPEEFDLYFTAVEGDQTPQLLVRAEGRQLDGQVSPDGRYLAYVSDESGQFEVYLRRFPSGEGKWQVSLRGGTHPRWTQRGARLLYVAGDDVMEVDVQLGDAPVLATPRHLFTREASSISGPMALPPGFDVTADGDRFLVIRDAGGVTGQTGITVVQNWLAEFAGK